MPDTKLSLEESVDEAVAPYFAGVHIGMISIIQGFAISTLIAQNVDVPSLSSFDWPYFLRGLTLFFLAISLWHAYVTQLAYVATLHWLHTLFPFLFGVLQFMLAKKSVLKPATEWHNLSYFMVLMSLTALTGAAAYTNTFYQHRNNRTERLFQKFGEQANNLYNCWGRLLRFFALSMAVVCVVFMCLGAIAKWLYTPCEEIVFPLFTTIVAGVSIVVDARFLAEHRLTFKPLGDIYRKVYGKNATRRAANPLNGQSRRSDQTTPN